MTSWGPLIDHTGGDCPVPQGAYIRAFSDIGDVTEGPMNDCYALGWNWSLPPDPDFGHVLCYQIRSETHRKDLVAFMRDLQPVPV
ncbi:MAG: hypothetical protein AAF891_00180 [Pseudomonadota bacterium]